MDKNRMSIPKLGSMDSDVESDVEKGLASKATKTALLKKKK